MTQDLSPEAQAFASRRVPQRPVESLRDQLANAPEAPDPEGYSDDRSELDPPPPEDDRADPQGSGGDIDQGSRGTGGDGDRPAGELYEDCPVTPLGVRDGHIYVLDALGQLRKVVKVDIETIRGLFANQLPQCCYHFPQWVNVADRGEPPIYDRKKGAFNQADVSSAMHIAAGECGVFNPNNAVRGVGAWTDDDGKLIYHAGDKVMVGGVWRKPGRIGKQIYPAYPPIPKPDDRDTAPDPVSDILDTLETWNWTKPDVHPFLTLGMIGAQMLGGALDWRPVFWLLAPAGAGKSELQKLLKLMHGDDGLVQTTDATKSGITSKLGQSSLPVAVDELEPGDERSTKERDIIQLARVAASGGEWFRGSSDQTGVGGKVYSSFLFSSILIPGVMKTQDVQRLVRLELQPLEKGIAKLNLTPRTWRARGARLKAVLMARWDTWDERMSLWRHALEQANVTGRDADNWGTVLAMADMAMCEDMPSEDTLSQWCQKVSFLAHADREETQNDADAMLLWLTSAMIDPFRRGQQYNIAQWLMAAAELPGAPPSMMGSDDPGPAEKRKRANTVLAQYGMRVYGSGQDAQLFLMNKEIQRLNELFRGSQWHGGVWKQSASRVPGAEPTDNPPTIAGVRSRGFMLPLKAIPGLTSFPMDRDDVVPGAADDTETPEHFA